VPIGDRLGVDTFQVPWDVAMVSIAPDGAIWVSGDQVARLGVTIPTS
jgi:hypothetical protein